MTLTTNPAEQGGSVAATAAVSTTTNTTANTIVPTSKENSHSDKKSESDKSSESDEKPQSDLSGIFTSDIVQLHVGPEQKVCTAHKAVLTHIPFFHKCLNKSFMEGNTNVVKLPEEVVAAVEYVLHYAYFHSLPEADFHSLPEADIVKYPTRLVRAYILADKWCMEDLENKLTDHFRSFFKTKMVDPDHISMLGEYGLADSHLRRLMLQDLVYYIRTLGWDEYMEDHPTYGASLLEYCRKGGDDVVDVLRSCMETTNVSNPLVGNPCDWHKHVSTEECTPP